MSYAAREWFSGCVSLLAGFLLAAACGGGVNSNADGHLGSSSSDTAPVVVSSRPATADTQVPINTSMQIVFSKSMDQRTVTTSSCAMQCGSAAVAGDFTWNGDVTITVFRPSNNLPKSTVCTVTLTDAIQDQFALPLTAANISFTTSDTEDHVQPTVASTSPAANATGVPINTTIRATFFKAVDMTTVTDASFSVSAAGRSVSGTRAASNDQMSVIFTPASNLPTNTIIVVSLAGTITDLTGNAISPSSFSFTTSSSTAPSVSSVSPASGSASVTKSTAVIINFSAAMDPASINANTFTLKQGSNTLSGSIAASADNTQFTFTPTSPLEQKTSHCVDITTGAKDASGTPLANNFESCFITQCSSSDQFTTANSLSCFSLYKFTVVVGIEAQSGTGSFLSALTIANGKLTMASNATNSTANGNGIPLLAKTLSSGDFTIETLIDPISATNATEAVKLVIINAAGDSAFVIYDLMGSQICANSSVNGSSVSQQCVNTSTTVAYFKITRSGNTYTASYKTSASAGYTDLLQVTRSAAGDALSGSASTLYAGLMTQTGNTLASLAPVFDYLSFAVGGASGQE